MTNTLQAKISFVESGMLSFSIVFLILICGGCASATFEPERMVPTFQSQPQWTTGRSVKVMAVTGDLKSRRPFPFTGPEFSNDQFRRAVISTLLSSGLFSEVRTDRGDLELYVSVVSQDVKVILGQETATMVVGYKFTDKFGNVVWFETYESEFSSVTPGAPSTRMVKIREGCAKENLSAFIQGIMERWPKE